MARRPGSALTRMITIASGSFRWPGAGLRGGGLGTNSAGHRGKPSDKCDHVHQLMPEAVWQTDAFPDEPRPQTVLPYGIEIANVVLPAEIDKETARRLIGIPANRAVVLSVGVLNDSHKRMS